MSLVLTAGLTSAAFGASTTDPAPGPSVSATVAATPASTVTASPSVSAAPTSAATPSPAIAPTLRGSATKAKTRQYPAWCLPPGWSPTTPWPDCPPQAGLSAKTQASTVAPDTTTGYHIKGTVTGSGGTPLANIYVEADSSVYQDYAWTASNGTYSVVVPAGSYTMWFSDSSGTYLDGYYSSGGFTVVESSATPVTIGSSDATGINVQMGTGYHIKGTVTGSGGTPLANIYVEADSSTYDGSVTTHGDGTYSVVVPAGSYTVWFSDPIGTYLDGYYSSGGFTIAESSATPVTIGSSDATGINVQMTPTALALSGFPSPAVAGMSHNITVTALDAYGNTAAGYTGTVHFTSSDAKAKLPANYKFTAADAGTHVFSVSLKTAGTQSVTVTDTATASIKGSQAGIVVNPAAVKTLVVSGLTTPRTAGSWGSIRVTATDAYGNRVHSYLGTVKFTSSDTKAKLPANYKFTVADAGTHVFSGAVILKTAGTQSVTATDKVTSTIKGAQAGIVVNAAALSKLVVSGLTTPRTKGVAGSIRVTATDAYGNRIHGYLGTVHFTSSDAKAKLPANYKFTAADAGTHVFTVTLKTAGTQWVRAIDKVTATVTGTQYGILVKS